jgi:long-chain acyl-CoA synthetase
VIAYFGILKAAGVVVFTTPLSEPVELARQVRDSGARVLVTFTRHAELARTVRAQTQLEHVILTNVKDYLPEPKRLLFSLRREAQEGHRLGQPLEAGLHLMSAELYKYSPHAPEIDVGLNDVALIQYTSGTTAQPKGVMLSHHNLVANTLQTRHWIPGLREGKEVFLSVVPFSHVYGMTAALNVPVALAAACIILPTFVTEDVLKSIRRYRPTIFPGVPTMYMAINNFPGVRRFGIESIKACISGAAPLPLEVQEAFEKLTRGRLVEAYGLTEATTGTHANPLEGLRKQGSIGIPLPSTEAKIVDLTNGRSLPPGQLGELAVRGPQVMLGYWNAGSAARETITRDGWLLTGDVARMDDDGYFEVVARKREMILAGDYQVYPRDVEEVLYENPKVKEVAVVGVQPPKWPFQRVKAYVVLSEGANVSEADLMAQCKRRLEEYAVPWKIEFVKELPKNFMGKVLRRLLVEEAAE